jgi:Flp pilus assembly protein TadG
VRASVLKPSAAALISRPWRKLRGFQRDSNGASAVEFAIVSVPFIVLLVGILELAIVFYAGEVLELSAAQAGRMVMTGQAQTAGYTAATYKAAVCSKLSSLFSCDKLNIKVTTYSSFTSASVAPTYTSDGQLDTASMTYAPGMAGSVVIVQLYYQWPIMFTVFNSWLINQSASNSNLLVATAVIQNEPYQ